MTPTIIVDVDGVLLNWFEGFIDFMDRELGILPSVESPSMYDLSDMYPDQDIAACIATFNHSEAFGYLTAMAYATDCMWVLSRRFGSDRVRWLSSCLTGGLNDAATCTRRESNIGRQFGFAFHGNCLPIRDPKWQYIEPSVRWVVEDSKVNAEGIVAHTQASVVLLDRQYNQGALPDGVYRVKTWDAAVDTITSLTPSPWPNTLRASAA